MTSKLKTFLDKAVGKGDGCDKCGRYFTPEVGYWKHCRDYGERYLCPKCRREAKR